MSDELAEFDRIIETLKIENFQANVEEAELEKQMREAIRLQRDLNLKIARLKDRRFANKQAIVKAERDRESAERKQMLAKEAQKIEQDLEKRLAELQEIIDNAPWKDTAFKWQIEGAARLPERAFIGDKRGLGKTLSALIWRRFQGAKRTLVCLRKEVADDFIKEIYFREPGIFVFNMIGVTPEVRRITAQLLESQEEYIVVTNIESWRRDIEGVTKAILKIGFDSVILDEAHHIKNSSTGTARGFFELADNIPKVLELSGTPIKNRPQEMFSVLHALYPQLFPTERKYLIDYCMQTGQNKWKFRPEGLTELVKRINHFYLARSPEDIGRDVPPPRIIEYKLDLDAHLEQKRAYRLVSERAVAELSSGKAIPIVSILAIMTRQAQMLSWPAGIRFADPETGEPIQFDVHQSVKIDWAEDLINELATEERRVLLFSRFKPAIYELEARLQRAGLSVAVITGDRKGNNREIFNDFDLKTAPENPKYQVLLATYQTVGESASLNAARDVILLDRFWNGGNEDQAIGRADRINNTDQATVHMPIVEHSFDEYMAELINSKRTIVHDFKEASNLQADFKKHLEKAL